MRKTKKFATFFRGYFEVCVELINVTKEEVIFAFIEVLKMYI
jgi:hypothetical protein